MFLLRCLLFALAMLLATATTRAQLPDPFAGLTGSGFDDIRRGIEALAISGHPQAAATIAALQAGTLLAGSNHSGGVGTLVVKQGDTLIDARTGTRAEGVAVAALRPVRVNNAVRRAAEAAMGSLTLFSPDPAERRRAAAAVFKSRDPASVPALTRALAAPQPPAVRAIMEQARAAALLATDDAAEADRLAAIDRQQQMWDIAQGAFYGVSLGSVLLLAPFWPSRSASWAVVFGGVGNLWGTLVSALTLGVLNKFLEPLAGAVLGKIIVLVLVILFIQRKPRGMFPIKGRAVET